MDADNGYGWFVRFCSTKRGQHESKTMPWTDSCIPRFVKVRPTGCVPTDQYARAGKYTEHLLAYKMLQKTSWRPTDDVEKDTKENMETLSGPQFFGFAILLVWPHSEVPWGPPFSLIAAKVVHANWKPTETVRCATFDMNVMQKDLELVQVHHDRIAEKLLAAKASTSRSTWSSELGEVS